MKAMMMIEPSMTTSILDIEALLAPISDTAPCGQPLLFSPKIDAITEARRFDDESLQQGEWQTEVKRADWKHVIQLSKSLLTEESKDLRFAIWLTEAITKHHGVVGLTQGLHFLTELFSRYWSVFYPEAADEMEQRVGHLRWMLQQIDHWVKAFPLTEGKVGEYNYYAIERARKLEVSSTENEETHRTQQAIDQAKRKSSRRFYAQTLSQFEDLEVHLHRLEQTTDQFLGLEGPSFSAAKESVRLVLLTVQRFANESGVSSAQSEVTATVSSIEGKTNPPNPNPSVETFAHSGRAFATESFAGQSMGFSSRTAMGDVSLQRAQALQQLREVAAFFRQTEPHSPVAYLAEKAADWGEMSLHEWLSAVIKDGQTLSQMEELLGMASAHRNESE